MLLEFTYDQIGLGNDFVSKLKDLAWRLKSGEEINYDYETVSLLEKAAEELDEYREGEFNYDEILEIAWSTLSDEKLKELINDIRHELNLSKKAEEKTSEEIMDQVIEWYEMSTKELKAELSWKDLKVTGNKKELVERLKQDWLLRYD